MKWLLWSMLEFKTEKFNCVSLIMHYNDKDLTAINGDSQSLKCFKEVIYAIVLQTFGFSYDINQIEDCQRSEVLMSEIKI